MYEEDLVKEFKKSNIDLMGIMFNDLNVIHPQFMFLMLDKDKEPKTEVIMAPVFMSNEKLKYLFAVKTLPKIIEEYREQENKVLCIAFTSEAIATNVNMNNERIEGTERDVMRITFETEIEYESHTWEIIKSESGKRYLGRQIDYRTTDKKQDLDGLFVNLL